MHFLYFTDEIDNSPTPKQPSTNTLHPNSASVKTDKHSELPPLPPPSDNNGPTKPPIPTDDKRPSVTSAPDIPTGNKRPSLSSSQQPPPVPSGNQRPSIGSLPRQQTMPNATGNKPRSNVPRQMSVQDYKDENLPPPPPSQNQKKMNPARKSSAPDPKQQIKPPLSAKPGQPRKQSLPTISQPIRQHSFQDYKNNIVPIPEPPSEDKQEARDMYLDEADLQGLEPSSDMYLDEADLKGLEPSPAGSTPTKNINKEDKKKEDTADYEVREDDSDCDDHKDAHKDNKDEDEEDKPKDYELLNKDSDFNSSQDIYLDLDQVSQPDK